MSVEPVGLQIEVRGLTKRFPIRNTWIEALAPVDLVVAPGGFTVLIGPSGCGKTTLLRSIAGLESPSGGTVRIGTMDPAAARAGRLIGFVPQAPALLPWRTVRQNVRLLAEVNRRPGTSTLTDPEVDNLLELVGLGEFASAKPAQLSGGMQQRVSLVRAFSLRAPVLLMDEPFAALDEMTRAEMRLLLLELWDRDRPTIVFTTHSLEEAVLLADHVAVMSARPGRILREHTIGLSRPRVDGVEDSDAFTHELRSLRSSLREARA